MHFRQFLNEQITAIERLLQSGDLAPNVKSAFTALRDQFKAALAALPGQDAAALDATAVATVLAGFGASLQSLNAAVVGMGEALGAQWNARITSGELIPKEKHTQLCTEAAEAARSAGLAQGKKDAAAEFNTQLATEKRAVERASLIARNGLPVAPDDVLRLDDDAFTARQKDAVARLEQTKAAGIDSSLKFVGRYAWAPSAEAEALAELVQAGAKKPGVNPLAGGSGNGTQPGAGNTEGAATPEIQFAL